MSNSSLVSFTKYSPNNSGKRTNAIDRISPHCVVAQWTAEQIGTWFAQPSAKASSNYGIGKDGKIGLYVDESNRSWCTSSSANDNRAVTIECASDTFHPYAMTSAVYESLVKLCADICKRNGKTKLLWFADKNKSLNYSPAKNEMVLTVHRWFANKACPGDWLYTRLGDLTNRVNSILGSPSFGTTSASSSTVIQLLKIGMSGQAVATLQDNLNKLGASLIVDGDFGAKTKAAVVEFQKKNELDPDGIVGPLTLAEINKQLANNEKVDAPFIVRVSVSDLNVRTSPGTSSKIVGYCPTGVYTIIETVMAEGLEWGKLKSGLGWIALKYVTRI